MVNAMSQIHWLLLLLLLKCPTKYTYSNSNFFTVSLYIITSCLHKTHPMRT